jgi:hypothetical protein
MALSNREVLATIVILFWMSSFVYFLCDV